MQGRSYQLSVYKIKGCDWYVNVQGASPLITYVEESKCSELLDKYKNDVAQSFREHLEKLIKNEPRCTGLVEVIYYDGTFFKTACKNAFYLFFLIADEDEQGKRIDVGSILKKYIEENQ